MEISPAPQKDNCLILLHPKDNVAVARVPLPAGRLASVEGIEIVLRDSVAAGHKVAIRAIEAGREQ